MKALVEVRGNQRVTTQNPEATYEALQKYGRDILRHVSQEKLRQLIELLEEVRGGTSENAQ